ncbi:MAG: fibronectin type III domain-containing protein [Janthinobacterium lividum]
MVKNYFGATTRRRLGLALALVAGTALGAQAQVLNYSTATASNVAGTYTDLATVTGSTVIATATTDDANSAAQNIGFSFSYNGTTFTQFVLNTNGIMRLGSAAPSVANLFAQYEAGQAAGVDPISSTSAADINLLAPFNFDLQDGSVGPAEYRVATTGTAPNQVCTIQWKNVRDKAGATNATQFDNFEFQVKLYQTTNTIEFVYGNTVSATAGASINRFPTVGVKGSGSAVGQDVLVNKTSSTAAWATAVFITGVYGGTTLNYRRTYGPDPGRTFRFAVAPANDAAVSAIYTLGKLATPAALPHTVRAVVSNLGTAALTNVPVTLTVTGANTFTDTKTVASLASGASTVVTFAAYPSTLNVGTNSLVVSVPNDGNTANNTQTYGQAITTNRLTYFDQTGTTTGGTGATNGVFATKFTLAAATVISDIALTFTAGTGNTAAYQVLLYDVSTGGQPGNILYTSAVQNRTAAGGVATVTVPSIAVPATFFAALKQTTATSVGIAYQTESPIRSSTFYLSLDAGTSWIDFTQATPPARVAIEVGTTVPSCAAPTAVAVSNTTSTTATVSFTAPTTGTSGYQVVYGPTGFDPASAGTTVTTTTSPVALTGLAPATIYQVYVRSNCTAGGTSSFTSAVSFATGCDPGATAAAAPYSLNFDTVLPGQTLPCGVAVLDANGDGATWAINRTAPYSGTNAMRYTSALANSQAADDWFFTPALTTTAGTRYQVAFRYRGEGIANSPSAYTERLEVKAGPSATVAGQTTTLYTNTAITNTSYALASGASAPAVAVWQPGAGTQVVGFHAISAATQGNIYVDDVSISTVLATSSEALLQAVTVFPNPSTTGLFDLDIHGAKAKGSLDVLVTNTLGQRVYTGSARDNTTNHLDLSTLAPGIYHLLVRTGDDFVTRQVSIVK